MTTDPLPLYHFYFLFRRYLHHFQNLLALWFAFKKPDIYEQKRIDALVFKKIKCSMSFTSFEGEYLAPEGKSDNNKFKRGKNLEARSYPLGREGKQKVKQRFMESTLLSFQSEKR